MRPRACQTYEEDEPDTCGWGLEPPVHVPATSAAAHGPSTRLPEPSPGFEPGPFALPRRCPEPSGPRGQASCRRRRSVESPGRTRGAVRRQTSSLTGPQRYPHRCPFSWGSRARTCTSEFRLLTQNQACCQLHHSPLRALGRIRTVNLTLTRRLLFSQLSYKGLVRSAGLEPASPTSSTWRLCRWATNARSRRPVSNRAARVTSAGPQPCAAARTGLPSMRLRAAPAAELQRKRSSLGIRSKPRRGSLSQIPACGPAGTCTCPPLGPGETSR